MKYLFQTFLVTISIIHITACGSSKKVTISATETPARLLPPLPASQINIPIKVYIRPMLAMMESMTSQEFTSDKWPNYTESSCDFRYKYRFVRSPFTVSCTNNAVNIAFQGNYQIAGSRCLCAFNKQISPWASGSCGFGNESLRKVNLKITSTLNLLPNHQLLTTTKLQNLEPLDKCQVSLMNNDMTGEVMDSIKASVESYCTVFDNFVQTINNSEQLRQWRSGGSRVMPVSKYGYLNLNPTALRVGRFNIYSDTLYFSLGYAGNPKFSSDSSRLVTNASLPPLNNADSYGGISTYLDAVYEYSFFNKLLNDSLRNKPFEVEGRTFVIKDVNVSGNNNGKVQVEVSFTGNRKGTLRISGTPVLDTAHQVLSMTDMDFDLDTKDILVNIAKGLFRKKIMKQLQNKSVLDIAALIEENKAVIEARLNQQVTDWMQTSGNFQEIRLVGLLPQKDYIQVQAYIKGNLVLIGSPPVNLLGMSY